MNKFWLTAQESTPISCNGETKELYVGTTRIPGIREASRSLYLHRF